MFDNNAKEIIAHNIDKIITEICATFAIRIIIL